MDLAIRVLIGKWKPQILWHLYTSNRPLRFAEIKRALDDITPKMLTRRLRELEVHQVLTRETYQLSPRRVEYSLTPAGKKLGPILTAMRVWTKEIE